MEELNKHSLRNSLIALNIGLVLISPLALAETADGSVQSDASINYVQYASNKSFVFNPRTLQWKAINANGQVVRSGHGSGGRGYCPDIRRSCRTPTGTYSVIAKSGPSCRSSRYPVGKGGAPMPYCMFFSKYYAVHGSPDVPNRNASHGCIRVVPSEARWLNQNFMTVGTKVVVKPY
jgi:lipoprotein-anchoring transpeptidase ErfK/SrfK